MKSHPQQRGYGQFIGMWKKESQFPLGKSCPCWNEHLYIHAHNVYSVVVVVVLKKRLIEVGGYRRSYRGGNRWWVC